METPSPMTAPAMRLPFRQWSDYTSRDFARLDRAKLIAVLPVGAIEQHGPHLPMAVDTAIINGMVDACAARLPADSPVLFLPAQPIGKSNEHARYPGTVTLSAATLAANWMEIGASVAAAGVRKLVLFNSHGGQTSVMDIVARDLRQQHDLLVVCVNWYGLGLPEGLIDADELRFGLHAGDLETSILLALHPALVRMEEARDFASRERLAVRTFEQLAYDAGNGLIAWQTQDLNPMGACGDATRATADKGQRVIAHVAERFAALMDEIDRLPLEWLSAEPAW